MSEPATPTEPNPAPSAPAPESSGSVMADLFPVSGDPAPSSPSEPPPTPSGSPPSQPEPSPDPDKKGGEGDAFSFDAESFISKYVSAPDEIFQDGKKIEQWQDLREVVKGTMKELSAAQLELAELKKGGAPSGEALPESEAVEKLQAEIEKLKPAAERWQEVEARESLRSNPAFRHEFDAPRAEILDVLKQTGEEAGMEADEVEEFLRLDSPYKQAKWVGENLTDDAAAGIFKKKGEEFLTIGKKAGEVLNSDDPIAALKEWEDYNAAFGTQFAAKLGEEAAKEFQTAAGKVVAQLGQSDDPFFTTDAGKKVLSDLGSRAAEGQGFTAEEVVESVALAQSASAYQALALNLRERAEKAETELARLRGAAPRFIPPEGGGQPAKKGEGFYGFDRSNDPKPMITLDQIKTS